MNSSSTEPNAQSLLWNNHSGHAWVDLQPVLDAMFQPIEHLLVDAVRAEAPLRVLDVGCGTGSTTLAIACGMDDRSHVTGIDISEPMLAAASSRAERENVAADFIHADAQDHPFSPQSIDMIVSRFGVMFFTRPVDAFTHLRRAARDNALLHVVAWRSPAENPFMTTAERTAAPLITLPPRQPGAPGQFAFADRDGVATMLHDSGWRDIDIQPLDVPCVFPAKDLHSYFSRLGPVGLAMQQVDERTRAQVTHAVRDAFAPYVDGDAVRFTAACWSIRARAPSTRAGTR